MYTFPLSNHVFGVLSWHYLVVVVTPTNHPKSVRNHCVIEVFGGVFVLSRYFLDFCCGCRCFYHRTESDLFLLLIILTHDHVNNFDLLTEFQKVSYIGREVLDIHGSHITSSHDLLLDISNTYREVLRDILRWMWHTDREHLLSELKPNINKYVAPLIAMYTFPLSNYVFNVLSWNLL